VTESDDADANHRGQRLAAVVGKLERTGHHAKPERSDRRRKHETVSDNAAAEADCREDHRQDEPEFVDDRCPEESARARDQRENDGGGEAVDKANRRKAHGHPVQPPRLCKQRYHCSARYRPASGTIQYYMTKSLSPPAVAHRCGGVEAALPSIPARPTRPLALSNLLFVVAAMVFAMVVVGGITRLTESGLSITEWRPVTGAVPPLSNEEWVEAFEMYKQIPEYRELRAAEGMTLDQFKQIYWWEFIHRLLGRLVGVVFALPLLWFAVRREIPRGYGWKMGLLLALGGLQGALGWYMVASGLTDRTDVSHFRLSAHLLLAFVIMGALIWYALDLRRLSATGAGRPARMTGSSITVLAILFVQLLYGAWVAGLDAGQVSNSWPLMDGSFIPKGIDWSNGVMWAFANDPYLIHFIHRWWAWIAVAALIVLARQARRAGSRPASIAIHSAFGVQIVLGIATVIEGVPLWLAASHQAVGALVVAATAWGAHVIGEEK